MSRETEPPLFDTRATGCGQWRSLEATVRTNRKHIKRTSLRVNNLNVFVWSCWFCTLGKGLRVHRVEILLVVAPAFTRGISSFRAAGVRFV